MKKILLFVPVLLALAACSKDNPSYSGSRSYNDDGPVAEYMKSLATDLFVDNLLALEAALQFDQAHGPGTSFATFETGGKSLREPGVRWTVHAVSAVAGVRITCGQEDGVWTLERTGDYTLRSFAYPTAYTLQVKQGETDENGHADWTVVSVSGSRTEDKGYSCSFRCLEPLEYDRAGSSAWDRCVGRLEMDVYQDGRRVDHCILELFGTSGQTRLIRIQ